MRSGLAVARFMNPTRTFAPSRSTYAWRGKLKFAMDSHSIHQVERGIWSITPAYDLLCTQPYASWNDPMALNFYGRANRWTRTFLVESSLRLGLPERATHRILDDVCSGVREAIGDVGAIGFD